ncbi:dicer-related [Holotrichia oblita]|uniref:Dicer-related n=1 Tax=Holotrichia oblita TaxID=644536 RepID=A0ACB9SV00_HOLOL|nr:dicer-related [Holotrichia oblita]
MNINKLYLIGQNDTRDGPSERDIQELYNEDELPPYYVDGPGSAHVNMVSAVSLLSTYCNSFEGDAYTSYAPNWYTEKKPPYIRVIIEMPTVCPYLKPIKIFRADELRATIGKATNIGISSTKQWKPLQLDKHLINYEIDRSPVDEVDTDENVEVLNMEKILSLTYMLNKEVVANTLQEEYPWEKSEEPVDIERNLNVTLMDIQYYLNFIKEPVHPIQRQIMNSPMRQKPAITYDVDFVPERIKMLNIALNQKGPELADIYRALATAKCNDIVNLERLETLGDSFLKFIVTLFIYLKYPKYNEGRSTTLKGQMVSNKNLYYLAKNRRLGSYLKYFDLKPKEDWCPPGFCLPEPLRTKSVDTAALLTITIPETEQITGILSEETFLSNNILLILGAILMVKWLEIIPNSINMSELFSQPPPNPVLNPNATQSNIDFHLPTYQELEKNLGYTFKNRAYLLQALTHSSYTPNRITKCYQTLEFLGDAVLDFLITMYIYETGEHLNPGDLTDLRSALVNNITFACFAVRCSFHKYLLAINNKLQAYIDKFIKYQENKNFSVDDDVLILLNEDDFHIAEYVDVPKVLGDLFESLVGAVFLDSGMNLQVVWDVFYRIMWKEINLFRNNVPKNAIRMLHETPGAHPAFQ